MLPLAKEVIDEKRLTAKFRKKVISALPLIPPRAPRPKITDTWTPQADMPTTRFLLSTAVVSAPSDQESTPFSMLCS
jgi:hypothetical protein